MSDDDANYYRRRAEAELEQARQATHHQAVRAHSQLANAYLDRVAASPPIGVVQGA